MITLQKAGKTATNNFSNRVTNIRFFAGLNREGLSYNQNTKNPVVYSTQNESVSFIYPGKETLGWYQWDFRPILDTNGRRMKDLSFKEIWEIFDTFVNSYQNEERQRKIVLLSRILYKTAFLQCHRRTNESFFDENNENINIDSRHIYLFDRESLREDEQELLSSEVITTGIDGLEMTISIESFIVYNDILCCNEDTKYFYRQYQPLDNRLPNEILNEPLPRNLKWLSSTGRINTFLTHINVLKNLHDGDTPYRLLADSALKRGVFQINNDVSLIEFLNS